MKKLFQLLKQNAAKDRAPFQSKAEGNDATFYLYDVIDSDYGISAVDFSRALAAVDSGSTLHLRINSPGGDVFEARAIASAIRAFDGNVVAHIDGLAASAATTIAAVADEVIIADGSFYMIHNAWTLALGDKNDFLETAALLEKIDGAILADYVARTKAPADEIVAMMDAETWMTAQEAVDKGFADKLAPAKKAKNETARRWNLTAYDKTPTELMEEDQQPTDEYSGRREMNARRLRLLEIE